MAKKNAASVQPSVHRQPIIAILGHVDHGKTSLLDYIRKTRLAAKEAGGITQSIGAYQAEFAGRRLTFIDTPGHAAFSQMRSRGVSVADVVVLVVAADDGVQPQTIESIKHIQAAGTPYVVAINKVDKPGVVPDTVKAQLTEHQVFVEGYGGNTPVVLISAKSGSGIDSLLETILLLSDLEELAYQPQGFLIAPIIEAKKDMKKGTLVSAIVKQGTLSVGDTVYGGSIVCKVRALIADSGVPVPSILPGEPVQILGFTELPEVGDLITNKPVTPVVSDASLEVAAAVDPVSDKLNIILKSSAAGSLQAIKGSLAEEINIITSGTGDITESDILMASTTGSLVLGFAVKVIPSAAKLAETEGVTVKNFAIIYELLEYLEKKVLRILEPTIDEQELGTARIIKIFEINADKVAGCIVEKGELSQGDTVHVVRKDGETKNARIKSIRVGKQEIKKVDTGKECGILLFPKLDLKEKDVIISYNKIKTDEE